MFLSLARNRRSIRRFEAKAIEPEKIDALIEGALRSPSSRGLDPWEFILVTDPQKLQRLSKCKPHGASFLKNAPLGIVVCADGSRSDVWVEDAAIAAIFIQMTAHSLGLGSCWIQFRKRFHEDGRPSEAHIAEILDLPDRLSVLAVMAVGYPAESLPGHPESSLKFDRIHRETFGQK